MIKKEINGDSGFVPRPSRRLWPAWGALGLAAVMCLLAAAGIIHLHQRADFSRQTELILSQTLRLASQGRASHERIIEYGSLRPKEHKEWKALDFYLESTLSKLQGQQPNSAALAHVQRAFESYRLKDGLELQALAKHHPQTAHAIEAAQGASAWRYYQQTVEDSAAEYDQEAVRGGYLMDIVTAIAFIVTLLSILWIFRRFRQDRYDSAYLTNENMFLRRSEKRFRSLIQNASEVVIIFDRDGIALYVSPVVRRVWGCTPESLLARPVSELIAPEDVAGVEQVFQQSCDRAGKTFCIEASMHQKNNTQRLCDLAMVNLLNEPEVFGIVVTFRDITDLKQGAEELRQSKELLEQRVEERTADLALANADLKAEISERQVLEVEREKLLREALERADLDPLTGLLNHRAFHKRFQEEADRAQRLSSPLAIVVLDLDNFKFFNDAYGHLVGDDVLRAVAALLKKCCRSYDTLARFGGDEFAFLMPGSSTAEIPRLAERLQNELASAEYFPPNCTTPIPLSLSIGIAVFPDDETSRLAALELADSRLLRAKTGADEADLTEQFRKNLTDSVVGFSMLDALVTAVNNKDRYTRRHSEDVMRYCLQIASEMGMDQALQDDLATAALLHDVGKIGIPDFVLRKPSALTVEEIEIIKHHPVMGAVIVAAVPGLERTLEAVRHHHERWDGGGYPDGLTGLEIPLFARLMAVADAYSAMTTDRPYRKGFAEGVSLGFLAEGAGIQWDPACVAAFLAARQRTLAQLQIDEEEGSVLTNSSTLEACESTLTRG